MSDVAEARSRRRVRWAIALLLVGLAVAFVPGLFGGSGFLRVVRFFRVGPSGRMDPAEWIEGYFFSSNPSGLPRVPWGMSAIVLVRTEFAWAVVAVSLAFVPAQFVWWRRADLAFVRTAGIACAVAASAAVIVLVASMRGLSDLPAGLWWTVPAGGALMAAAFLVAPAPRPRDDG